MLDKNSLTDLEATVNSQLDEVWAVEMDEGQVTVRTDTSPLWVRIEPRRDDSFIITGYHDHEWDGQDEVPILTSYIECGTDAAIEAVLELCRSQAKLLDDFDTVPVEAVAETLETTDAAFAAVPEDHLARGLFEVIYHVPAGGDDAGVADALREFDAVEIGGKPYPIRLSSVLAAETHLYRRVPLYAEAMAYGPKEVTVEDGVRQVTEFVQNDENPTPLPSESIAADKLAEKLVEAGAVAVAVEPEISNEDLLTLSVWVPDATAYEVVGQYQTISVEGNVLDLNFEFCCVGGPNFLHRVPVYADDDIIGMGPVPIDEGISNLQEYVASGCPRSVVSTQWGEKR